MTTMRDLARHLAIIISTLCVIAMWIVAGNLYPKLPAKIPLHFNLSGVPDSYGPPNFSNWFLLPVIATLLSVFLLGISALILFLLRFAPEIVNIPRKQELLALPADAQRRAIQLRRHSQFVDKSLIHRRFGFSVLARRCHIAIDDSLRFQICHALSRSNDR
jgi:hypothetical protein